MPYASDLQGRISTEVGMLAVHEIDAVVASPIFKPPGYVRQADDNKPGAVAMRFSGHATDDLFLNFLLFRG